MSNNSYSIVEIFGGGVEGHRCGYCGGSNGSLSFGMWAHSLTIQAYQELIDRGWRRSGKYCYKPLMDKTCCPSYTIKCDTTEFKLSKSQKKVLRRMHNYLARGITRETGSRSSPIELDSANSASDHIDIGVMQRKACLAEQNMEEKILSTSGSSQMDGSNMNSNIPATQLKEHNLLPLEVKSTDSNDISSRQRPAKGAGADPTKPPCIKSKEFRKKRRLQKMADKPSDHRVSERAMQRPHLKLLQQHLKEPLPNDAVHKLEIKLVRSQPPSLAFQQTFDQTYNLYKKYQLAIHKDAPESCTAAQFNRFLVNSPLEIKVVKSWPQSPEFVSSLDESYSVYKRYQMEVHHESDDETDKESYLEFLVVSPLKCEESTAPLHPGYGSFHQQYWLDGKLLAVGVIDVLPNCLSSVYFYYDPSYNFLSLGTYGALREIAFVQELTRCSSNLEYYYMGFYIHSCIKMRYKGHFHPSYLLCPEVYSWHPIQQVQCKLDASKYSRLNNDIDQEDEVGKVTSKDIMVLQRQRPISYEEYLSRSRKDSKEHEDILEYGRYVGRQCAPSLLLFRK